MRDLKRDPRFYELLTILSPEVSEEELPAQIDRIGEYVSAAGGNIQATQRESPWGRRRLAYPIRHSGRDLRDGFYTLFHVELPPSRIGEVERDLKLNPLIMRYLLTHFVAQPIDPQAVEDAEIAAEDAAAEAYAASQVAAPQDTETVSTAIQPSDQLTSSEPSDSSLDATSTSSEGDGETSLPIDNEASELTQPLEETPEPSDPVEDVAEIDEVTAPVPSGDDSGHTTED